LVVELQGLLLGGIEEVGLQQVEEHAGVDDDVPLLMLEAYTLVSLRSEQILDLSPVVLVFL
jgi:hypothetical protein